jgi:hypothetical protein
MLHREYRIIGEAVTYAYPPTRLRFCTVDEQNVDMLTVESVSAICYLGGGGGSLFGPYH